MSAENVSRAQATPRAVSSALVHCEMMTTLKPVVRRVHAVLATETLLAAPCRCSMMMWLIGDGHASNAPRRAKRRADAGVEAKAGVRS